MDKVETKVVFAVSLLLSFALFCFFFLPACTIPCGKVIYWRRTCRVSCSFPVRFVNFFLHSYLFLVSNRNSFHTSVYLLFFFFFEYCIAARFGQHLHVLFPFLMLVYSWFSFSQNQEEERKNKFQRKYLNLGKIMPHENGGYAPSSSTAAPQKMTVSPLSGKDKNEKTSTIVKPPSTKPSFIQLYTASILVLDLFVVFLVWISPSSARLTEGTMWFDHARDNRLETVVLFSFIMMTLVLSSFLALCNTLNRWVLLHHTLVEFLRFCLFSCLLIRLEHPRNRHTILLAFMLLNVVIHGHNWYSTWCFLHRNAL